MGVPLCRVPFGATSFMKGLVPLEVSQFFQISQYQEKGNYPLLRDRGPGRAGAGSLFYRQGAWPAPLSSRRFPPGEDWSISTGDVADREASQQVTVYTGPVEASIEITQIVPDEYEEEGFTYYDEEVQDRLAYTLLQLTQEGNYTLESPLAILKPLWHRLQRPVPVLRHQHPHQRFSTPSR